MSDIIHCDSPPEERILRVLEITYRGIHHAPKIHKHSPRYWTVNNYGDLSTYDWDTLTRLVIAAHDLAVRVEIGSSGPRRVKLHLSARTRTGEMTERHPTIDEAIDRFRNGRRS